MVDQRRAPTELVKDRAFLNYLRVLAGTSAVRYNTDGSGTFTTEACLLFGGTISALASGLASAQFLSADTSGPAISVIAQNGIGSTELQLNGMARYCPAGVAVDFTGSTASTYAASVYYVPWDDVPWRRLGLDEPDVRQAFDQITGTSRVFNRGEGGGSGGGITPDADRTMTGPGGTT